jgi:enamine deaminase RidA (YjgF/YER057c/UK114 family)
MKILQPAGWPRPSGYSNGIAAEGRMIVLAGQIGWKPTTGRIAEGIAAQVEQALVNIVAVMADANAQPADIVRLTWFVADMEQYRTEARTIGQRYRRVMGRHFPAMSVIGVSSLVERDALVEIEATAVLRD